MKTITGTAYAHKSPYHSLKNYDGLSGLMFSQRRDIEDGWTLVGEAFITVTLFDEAEQVKAQVASLKAQQTKIRAEAQAAITRLDERIADLLAITDQTEREVA